MSRSRALRFVAAVMLVGSATGSVMAASVLDEAMTAVRSFFSPAEPTSPRAQARQSEAETAFRDAVRLRSRGDTAAALGRLREAAGAGHAGAAYELGLLYTQGRDVAEDLERGARWINRAADLGDARAQYLVGANLMSGTGVPRDPSRGVGFLARAGEQGHPRAQYLLGQAYVDGVGVAASPAWAARWYGRAARAGHAGAQYAYGVMFQSGLGVPKSPVEAYRWLLLASDNGQPRAVEIAARVASRLPTLAVARIRAETDRFVPRVQSSLSDSPSVLFVQHALSSAGYDAGPLDGLMGTRTRAGIRAFQRDTGVAATGEISATLLERLISHTTPSG